MALTRYNNEATGETDETIYAKGQGHVLEWKMVLEEGLDGRVRVHVGTCKCGANTRLEREGVWYYPIRSFRYDGPPCPVYMRGLSYGR